MVERQTTGNPPSPGRRALAWLGRKALVLALALVAVFGVFMFLPLLQALEDSLKADLVLVPAPDVLEPPPPPTAEEEPEPEPEEEEPPPELEPQDAPPLDLASLELALNPGGIGGDAVGAMSASFLKRLTGDDGSGALDDIFSLSDLDQKPRPVYQQPPKYPADWRRAGRAGTVFVLCLIDVEGRVINPKVERSTDPGFNPFALEAVKQWRFEPGVRNGKKVPFKIQIPITFDAG